MQQLIPPFIPPITKVGIPRLTKVGILLALVLAIAIVPLGRLQHLHQIRQIAAEEKAKIGWTLLVDQNHLRWELGYILFGGPMPPIISTGPPEPAVETY